MGRLHPVRRQRGFAAAVSSGEAVCGIGLTEPGAGSDVSLIATRAERSSDGSYRLDGEKIFISNAGIATHLVPVCPDRCASQERAVGVPFADEHAGGCRSSRCNSCAMTM
jgi:alkylation response protein AidB-like acyl-CoA dehydrogenase